MNESYVRIPREEAKKLAEQTINLIKKLRDQRWQKAVSDYRWWSWLLPWRRQMSDFDCKAALIYDNACVEISLLHWREEDRSKAVGHLCKIAGSDTFVYLCANDAERIQFGETYKRLANV